MKIKPILIPSGLIIASKNTMNLVNTVGGKLSRKYAKHRGN